MRAPLDRQFSSNDIGSGNEIGKKIFVARDLRHADSRAAENARLVPDWDQFGSTKRVRRN